MSRSTQEWPGRWLPHRRFAVLAFIALLLAGCGSGDESGEVEGNAARYNMGDPINDSTYALIVESPYGSDTLTTEVFRGQFYRFVQQVPAVAQDPEQSRQLRRGIAEEFIRRHLIGGEADRLAIDADSGLVEEQIGMIRSQFPDEQTFADLLSTRGITMDSLRRSIAEELRLEAMQERMIEAAPQPTQVELDAFREEQAEQVRAQHILFRVPDASKEDSVLNIAKAVLDSVQAGADFAELAGRYGSDGTRTRGGDLGYFSRGEMVEPFANAAFALADSGDVTSELVETSFGYHIIRLTGRRTSELMDTTRARAMVLQKRQREAFEASYDSLRSKATIRVNPDVIEADLNAET